MKFGWKSTPESEQIHEKTTLGAVLEHFGDPLDAKVAQKRERELEHLENIDFWGRPGLQNGVEILKKST